MIELVFIVATFSAALVTVIQSVRSTSILVKIWGVSWLLCALISVLVWGVFRVNEFLGDHGANIVAVASFLLSYWAMYSRLGKIGERMTIGDLNTVIKTVVKETINYLQQGPPGEESVGLTQEDLREISRYVTDEIKSSLLSEISKSRRFSNEELLVIGNRLNVLMGDKLLTDAQAEGLAQKILEKIGPGIRGLESQAEGISFQDIFGACLELMGFEVENFRGKERPDHLLYTRNELIAVGSSKAYTITTSWTFTSQRVGEVELHEAKNQNLPLVLAVLNKATGRLWIRIIEPADLKGEIKDFSLTAPKWLWKPELTEKERQDMAESRRLAGKRLREMLKREETHRQMRRREKSYQ